MRCSTHPAPLVAALVTLVMAGPAPAQLGLIPRHYTGTWVNNTFSSTGPVRADLIIQGGTARLIIDAGGNVFGMSDPDPLDLVGPISAAGWSASAMDHPTYGDVQASINAARAVSITCTNIPGGFITGSTATGTAAPGMLHLDGTITFMVGAPADTDINLALTPYSTLISTNEILDGRFGSTVAGVPDVNGDGRGDVIVGAPGETAGGQLEAGRAYLYRSERAHV